MVHAHPQFDRIQDPHKKIPEDEPVFLIRGQDRIGARIVEIWADMNENEGGSREVSEIVRAHAKKMEKWPRKKLADVPNK